MRRSIRSAATGTDEVGRQALRAGGRGRLPRRQGVDELRAASSPDRLQPRRPDHRKDGSRRRRQRRKSRRQARGSGTRRRLTAIEAPDRPTPSAASKISQNCVSEELRIAKHRPTRKRQSPHASCRRRFCTGSRAVSRSGRCRRAPGRGRPDPAGHRRSAAHRRLSEQHSHDVRPVPADYPPGARSRTASCGWRGPAACVSNTICPSPILLLADRFYVYYVDKQLAQMSKGRAEVDAGMAAAARPDHIQRPRRDPIRAGRNRVAGYRHRAERARYRQL